MKGVFTWIGKDKSRFNKNMTIVGLEITASVIGGNT